MASSGVCCLESQTEGAKLSRDESNFIAAMFGAGIMVSLASRSVLPLLAMIFSVGVVLAIISRWPD
jgi:hypothetical protein